MVEGTMLDYTLVSPKASYRLLTPRDIPAFVQLVQAFYRESLPEGSITVGRIAATVRELEHDRSRGTVFVFDREETLMGYCIVINYWSNELGGNVLCVDELYVVPGARGQGIASDFLNLLAKVAPPECTAIQAEIEDRNRRTMGFYKKLGFQDERRRVLYKPIERGTHA